MGGVSKKVVKLMIRSVATAHGEELETHTGSSRSLGFSRTHCGRVIDAWTILGLPRPFVVSFLSQRIQMIYLHLASPFRLRGDICTLHLPRPAGAISKSPSRMDYGF